ncbi:MAG TPA: hypothetical protein VHP55_13065 [Usitatibacter sp.]|jgi:hypothetical protein|nr:hypothetical protein [Usitatibacter sp.]
MRLKHLNPYSAYLDAEVRKARFARDLAVAHWILHAAEAIAEGVASFVARILRLEMRRDDAWVESMETKLRQHQPY